MPRAKRDTVVLTRSVHLEIRKYITDKLHDFAPDNFQIELSRSLKFAAYELAVALRLYGDPPVKRLLAEYPTTLWDHIKKVLGFPHRTVKIYQEETVVYPSISSKKVPAYVHVRTWPEAGDGRA